MIDRQALNDEVFTHWMTWFVRSSTPLIFLSFLTLLLVAIDSVCQQQGWDSPTAFIFQNDAFTIFLILLIGMIAFALGGAGWLLGPSNRDRYRYTLYLKGGADWVAFKKEVDEYAADNFEGSWAVEGTARFDVFQLNSCRLTDHVLAKLRFKCVPIPPALDPNDTQRGPSAGPHHTLI